MFRAELLMKTEEVATKAFLESFLPPSSSSFSFSLTLPLILPVEIAVYHYKMSSIEIKAQNSPSEDYAYHRSVIIFCRYCDKEACNNLVS